MAQTGTGKTGLMNLGNTCFMNSCLQCLSHSPELYAICMQSTAILDKDTVECQVSREWLKLRELMWKEDCTISPGGFLASIQQAARKKGDSLFTGFAQNDVGEFLRFVIVSCMHQALSTKVKMTIKGGGESTIDRTAFTCYKALADLHSTEYSPIVKTFYGMATSTVTFDSSSKLTAEPYFVLSLPVPNRQCTLYDCFDEHMADCNLDGENQYETDDGRMVDAVKKDGFWDFPDVLIIELKRFDNGLMKNNHKVECPLETLNLAKYVQCYDAHNYMYELFGVCNHSGRVCGGHYTAYAKSHDSAWSHFNDRSVTRASPSEVISSRAYCLFYRKK